MANLVVIGYDDEFKADEVRTAVKPERLNVCETIPVCIMLRVDSLGTIPRRT
jgi:uncharacterized membrane protein